MAFFYELLIWGCIIFIGLPFFVFILFNVISKQISRQQIIDARRKTKWKLLMKSVLISSAIVALLLYVVRKFYILS